MRRAVLSERPRRGHLVVRVGRAVEHQQRLLPRAGAPGPASPRRSRGCRRTARRPPRPPRPRPRRSPGRRRDRVPPDRAGPCRARRTASPACLHRSGWARRARPLASSPRRDRAPGRSGWRRAPRASRGAEECEGLPLAQAQEARDMVDIAIGQDDVGDGAVAPCLARGCSAGVARICCLMSGEAFRSSQRSPSAETATLDCVRGRAFGVAGPGLLADGTPAVPLRKAAAGRRAEHDDAQSHAPPTPGAEPVLNQGAKTADPAGGPARRSQISTSTSADS